MRSELNDLENVDRYLDGSMSAAERDAFEQRMASEPAVRAAVQDQQALREGLWRLGVRAAAASAQRQWLWRRWLPWAVGSAVIVAVGLAAWPADRSLPEEHVPEGHPASPITAAIPPMQADTTAIAAVPSPGTTRVESVFMPVRAERLTRTGSVCPAQAIPPDSTATHDDGSVVGPSVNMQVQPKAELGLGYRVARPIQMAQAASVDSAAAQKPLLATVEMPGNADVQPQFPGGFEAMQEFIATHIKQPRGKRHNGIVTVHFTINKKGAVEDVRIERSLDAVCDREALRVIGLMPNWRPAQAGERPVKSAISVPIRFSGARVKERDR